MSQGLKTDLEPGGSLPMLALLWDELAGGCSCAGFEREFRQDLERLSRFRNHFPEASPAALISLLEAKVIAAFRERFPREAVQTLRARLNRSN